MHATRRSRSCQNLRRLLFLWPAQLLSACLPCYAEVRLHLLPILLACQAEAYPYENDLVGAVDYDDLRPMRRVFTGPTSTMKQSLVRSSRSKSTLPFWTG